MNENLTIQIDNDCASSLIGVLANTLRLLSAVDSEMTGERQPAITWHIKTLSKSSPIQLVLSGELRHGRDEVRPILPMLDGLRQIEDHAIRPRFFSTTAMTAARSLVADKTPFELRCNGSAVRPTINVLAHVDTILRYTSAYSADMAIDGRLDAIFVHGDRPQFFVFDPITDKGIRCYFAEEHVDEIVQLLTDRVRVFGLARFNKLDEIVSMQVEDFERLPEQDEVPSLAELHAAQLNITAGEDAADFIRRLRNAE
jgi:hypothetical protein